MHHKPPQPKLLTRQEIAARYALCLRTVDGLLAAGKLPHFRIGSAIRFDPDEVDVAMRKRFHVASQTTTGHASSNSREEVAGR